MEAMGLEYEDFSEDQCHCMYTWEFFAYIYFGIRKTPTWKISTNQAPPGESSPWNIPTHVFKYSHPSFLIYFFIIFTVIIDIT